MVIKVNININKVKIVVMVPRSNADSLREIICNTGAGVIGNYTDCSVSTKVIGTFKPNSKANPTIGRKEKLEKVKEIKLEVICRVEKVKEVLEVIKKNHPYETPGIDIIPLMDRIILINKFYQVRGYLSI